MKKIFLIAMILLITSASTSVSSQTTEEPDYQCIGTALARYMNRVVEGVEARKLSNVRLLTPAFNMTSFTFEGIVNGMQAGGAKWNSKYLVGIAGNIYHVDGQSIQHYLREKTSQMPAGLKALPIYITETGKVDVARGGDRVSGLTTLGEELAQIKANTNIKAALLFNPFKNNKEFAGFAVTPAEISQYLCGSGCGKIGVNYAVPFPSAAGTFYDSANALSMQYRLAIATIGSEGNVAASAKSVMVYAIAGPNEPETEHWAAPNCQYTTLAKNGPLEEGFYPQRYACNATEDPEYHPLRPYPGSPCDPLIPRSIPEAKDDIYKKYNTFACGSSLTPASIERFDPYGKNELYESLSIEAGDQTYAHTICDPVPDNDGGSTATCYRSSAFNLNLDLTHANLGILGNTQDRGLTDAQKVNEYLSWYLTGTPQIGDQLPVNPDSDRQIDRVINYSGPLRKLLPYDLTNLARSSITNSVEKEVHNYAVGCAKYDPAGYIASIATAVANAAGGILKNDLEAATAIANMIADGTSLSEAAQLAATWGIAVVQNFGEIWQAGQAVSEAQIAQAIACEENSGKTRLSDYSDSFANGFVRGALGNLNFIRDDLLVKLVQNIPFSSMEDIAGEVTLGVFRDPNADQQSPKVEDSYSAEKKKTAPLQLRIIKADPPTRP